MIKKMKISFPHAVESFWICCDNEKLVSLLEIYYGSMMEYVDKIGVIALCYINDTFFIKEDSSKHNIQKKTFEIAFCNIVAYIRHNVHLEKDWFFYHGSCAVVGNKTYLFLGSSRAGKTTLTTFLNHQSLTTTVSEDICIINYNTCEVESIKRPFFLRPDAYMMLKTNYNIEIPINGSCIYNINEKIITNSNNIVPNITYKIDEILFLHLREGTVKKQKCEDINELLYNSYNTKDINKGIYVSNILCKSVPMFKLYYYDLNEVYQFLLD